MTRTEHDAENPPHERRAQGNQRRAFDRAAEVGKELFHQFCRSSRLRPVSRDARFTTYAHHSFERTF